MSFRRYVGKYVQVTARSADGVPETVLAKLFEYEEGGIWVHHSSPVSMPDGSARTFSGYRFIPREQIITVFGCDELDQAVEEQLAAEGGGA